MASLEEQVLVLAPTGRDGRLIEDILGRSGISSAPCASIDALSLAAIERAGALFIAEEALTAPGIATLGHLLEQQPPWSDLPVIVSTTEGATTEARIRRLGSVAERGNIVIVERPVRTSP